MLEEITSNVITIEQVEKLFNLKKEAKKLKLEVDILSKHIKENLEENMKTNYGDFIVKISVSERVILDTKSIKEMYPKIYDSFGKTQIVKTLNIKEI